MTNSFADAIKNLEHYRALGHTEIHLGGYGDSEDLSIYPWHLVDQVESGGGYVGGMTTGVNFRGHADGMEFRWHVTIEDRASQERISLHTQRCIETMNRLPEHLREKFAAVLESSATELEKHAAEYLDQSNRYLGIARDMRTVSALAVPDSEAVSS